MCWTRLPDRPFSSAGDNGAREKTMRRFLNPALLIAITILFPLGSCGSTEATEEPSSTSDPSRAEETPPTDPASRAIAETSAAREKRAATVRYLVERAKQAGDLGKHEEARRLYRRALDYDANDQEARFGYDAMTRLLGGKESADAADGETFDRAKAKTESSLAMAELHYAHGVQARNDGNVDLAVRELEASYRILRFESLPRTAADKAREVKKMLDSLR